MIHLPSVSGHMTAASARTHEQKTPNGESCRSSESCVHFREEHSFIWMKGAAAKARMSPYNHRQKYISVTGLCFCHLLSQGCAGSESGAVKSTIHAGTNPLTMPHRQHLQVSLPLSIKEYHKWQ